MLCLLLFYYCALHSDVVICFLIIDVCLRTDQIQIGKFDGTQCRRIYSTKFGTIHGSRMSGRVALWDRVQGSIGHRSEDKVWKVSVSAWFLTLFNHFWATTLPEKWYLYILNKSYSQMIAYKHIYSLHLSFMCLLYARKELMVGHFWLILLRSFASLFPWPKTAQLWR